MNDSRIPTLDELPEETKAWLAATEAVQSHNILIRMKAHSLLLRTDCLNVLAARIVKYTSLHEMRLWLWYFFNALPTNTRSGWAKYLDAASSLFFGGTCTGRANLGTALFRANGVPARVLHVMPTWSSGWYDMHYISEYYSLDNGWVLAETVLGITPLEQKQNIILRVNYPADEDTAGNRGDYYGGCEPWFWMDANVMIYWTHQGSGAQSWLHNALWTDNDTSAQSLAITKMVYPMFIKYAGVELTGENQHHYSNAILAEVSAINCFTQLDITGYLANMTLAYQEFSQISYP